MNISRIILISLVIFVFSNTSINNLTKEQEESLKACLLIKIQAPYLKLDCDNIAQNNTLEQNESNRQIDSQNLRKEKKNQNIRAISSQEIQNNIKKIKSTDEIKLRNLIIKLRN